MSLRRTDLTTGSIPHHLARLSIPMVWGILSIVSMQLADVYFVAGLGQTELEAISFTFPVSMVIFNLVMGLSIGTSSVASRLVGAGDDQTFKRFVVHALAAAIMIAIFLAVLGELLLVPVFNAMGASPAHLALIIPFMQVQLWGYVFITVPLVLNAAMRALGDTRLPAMIMVTAAVVNVPLAYAFVYGAWGAPALGMTGAGVANVIANAIIAALALAVMVLGRRGLNERAAWGLAGFGASMRRLLPIAVPVGVMNLLAPLTTAVITAILASSGAAAVAAYGLVGRIEAVAAVVLMALSVGMSPLVGQNYGAKNYARVVQTLDIALKVCVGWSILTGLFLMVFGGMLARAFSADPLTVHIVATYFIIMGIARALPNAVVGWGSLWYAMGKPQYGMINNIGVLVVGTMLAGWLGHALAGWYGLFVAIMIGQLTVGLALHLWSMGRLAALLGIKL
jgi:putative MATE family efflux protein